VLNIAEKQSKNKKEDNDYGNILDNLDQFNPKVEPAKNEEEELIEEAPSPNQQFTSNARYQQPALQPQMANDQMQEMIEEVIEEKWGNMVEKFGDLGLWKERTNRDIISLKQELVRTQDKFNQLQRAVLGKVSEYNDNISNLGSEMKALERVFEKIVEPLTTNIKELQRITERLKK